MSTFASLFDPPTQPQNEGSPLVELVGRLSGEIVYQQVYMISSSGLGETGYYGIGKITISYYRR